jgi:hypothetical protein
MSNQKVIFFKVNLLVYETENGVKFGRVWSEEVLVVFVGVNIFGETETMLISEAIEDNERALRCHTLKRVVLSMFLVGVINF